MKYKDKSLVKGTLMDSRSKYFKRFQAKDASIQYKNYPYHLIFLCKFIIFFLYLIN